MTEKKPVSQMLISYVPGEECRVAMVEDGKLEEFHAERASSISRVGNIYVGTVTNVEPSIQAAFIDFGVEHHGFLHVTDVHPRYFPGEDEDTTTERVGKKTPRRERPPIQRCFKRGDQIEVQVLKEGVGTKGPTLTSYLSIPGRFLVMMPQMDRVGVSRKVEDEDQRRAMREILDQLELPEGFGFIVRTAGMDRTKLELKRDLAYLMRLWKDMEARNKAGNKPRLLYSESDLLVRALRDMITTEIEEIVIDNDLALARAARFLKIVSPRSKVKLLQYAGHTPLFHAFGIEQQLALIHAREVPLPGGGRLVIDETEALVAIDVNSGKMRDARDAETNAYKTNCEAVEEICRQLKLRDLGGIVINDLIDMRHASHRKDIEHRFRERMKRDRSRSTLLPISEFGILEMTRQRMRGSHESIHFVDCPTCRGRGLVQKPDSIAADALRNLAAVLDHENVSRVEMVVSPRVASELLSSRRKSLNKIERTSGRHVDVRVSETVPVDRVTFYAYDVNGADIDVERLPKSRTPSEMKVWELARDEGDETWATDVKDEQPPPEPELTEAEQAEVAEMPAHPIEFDEVEGVTPPAEAGGEQPQGEGGRRRRRRRGGRGRGGEGRQQQQQQQQQQRPPAPAAEEGVAPADGAQLGAPAPDGTMQGPAR
jgi:ribonuclease E